MRISKAVVVLVLSAFAVQGCSDAVKSVAPENVRASTSATKVGWMLRDDKPWRFEYEVQDSMAVFQGDINLGRASSIPTTREALMGSSGNAGARFNSFKANASTWYDGVVPYEIASGFSNTSKIFAAMDSIEARTGSVKFRPKQSGDNHWIVITRTFLNICGRSDVGRTGGSQIVLFHEDCPYYSLVHEFMHTLGFWHEQSRCDRDSYVTIVTSNIFPERLHNFEKYCGSVGYDIGSYDELSILHYQQYDHSMNGQPTIISLRGLGNVMGTSTTLSAVDVFSIQAVYPPFSGTISSVSNSGGYPHITIAPVGVQPVSYYIELEVNLLINDDYNSIYTSEWYSTTAVGSSYSTTYTDNAHQYTGSTTCEILRTDYETRMYVYDYVIYAVYANGAWGRVMRAPAPVGLSSCY